MRGVLKWTVLTVIAVTLGGSAGAAYKIYVAPPDAWILVDENGNEVEPLDHGTLVENVSEEPAPVPPEKPVPRDPAANATTSSLTPTFRWDAGAATGPVVYSLEIVSRLGTLETRNVIHNIEGESWSPASTQPFAPGSKVTWRLMALDGTLMDSGWTEPQVFHVLVKA